MELLIFGLVLVLLILFNVPIAFALGISSLYYLFAGEIDDLKRNRSTLEEASNELGRHCVCGIFNTKRAKEILSKFI